MSLLSFSSIYVHYWFGQHSHLLFWNLGKKISKENIIGRKIVKKAGKTIIQAVILNSELPSWTLSALYRWRSFRMKYSWSFISLCGLVGEQSFSAIIGMMVATRAGIGDIKRSSFPILPRVYIATYRKRTSQVEYEEEDIYRLSFWI